MDDEPEEDDDRLEDKEEVPMNQQKGSSQFQEAIETVEALPSEDQILLIELIRQRLIQQRRAELAAEVAEARQAYQRGEVRRGTVEDLMKELAR